MIAAEKTGPREVTFRFDMKGNRELRTSWPAHGPAAALLAACATASRATFQDDAEAPLGSGPYRIKSL